jgi:hypothetical protein
MDLELPAPYPQQEELHAPVPVKVVDPGYPAEGVGRGAVVLQLRLEESGRVEAVDVVRDVPTLTDSAIEAVCQWKYSVPSATPLSELAAVAVISFQDPSMAPSLPQSNLPRSGRDSGIRRAQQRPIAERPLPEAGGRWRGDRRCPSEAITRGVR